MIICKEDSDAKKTEGEEILLEAGKTRRQTAKAVEDGLLYFLSRLKKENLGLRNGTVIDESQRGFYYHLIKNLFTLGIQVTSSKVDNDFQKLYNDKKIYQKILNSFSGRLSRLESGSERSLLTLKDTQDQITGPSLFLSLYLAEFFVLTEGISDKSLINLLRPGKYNDIDNISETELKNRFIKHDSSSAIKSIEKKTEG